MRVLHVTPYFAPAFCYGGPPRSILGLCKALQSEGLEVVVYTTTANGIGEPLLASSGIAREYEGVPVHYFPLWRYRKFFYSQELRGAMRRNLQSFDLVHVHGTWNLFCWTAISECLRQKIPYVLSPRGMMDTQALQHSHIKKQIAYALIEKRNIDGASLLHATSVREFEGLNRLGISVPVVLVPNGIAGLIDRRAHLGTFRSKYGIPADVRLITWLGRLHTIKRLDLLADAVKHLRALRSGFQVVIAGPDEHGLRPALEGRFAASATPVHFVGEVTGPEKEALLVDADVLVSCSDTESFGMTVLEALAAGTPVIATRTCPWAELTQANAGCWVDHNVEAIAQALVYVLGNRQTSTNMGRNGQRLVAEKYTWASLGPRMVEGYRGVLHGRADEVNVHAASRTGHV